MPQNHQTKAPLSAEPVSGNYPA